MPALTAVHLRRYAVARSLFPPTTLAAAIRRMGFVQADPIRAPARAQDLTLRPRVTGYRAGDLERRYPDLPVEEDVFVNYGFVSTEVHRLMHPRRPRRAWTPATRRLAEAVLAFVEARGEVHPREVDAHFAHGRVTNYWGGSSAATTHLLDDLQHRGLVRVVRRNRGVRVYARRPQDPTQEERQGPPRVRLDALVDVLVQAYAPLPARTLGTLVGRLRHAVPQWTRHLAGALGSARERLARARVGGVDWYWPAGEDPASPRYAPEDRVTLLAPFDPVVWDRLRFELLWGWPYRFEAYTPVPKRKLGYYALPLLRQDRVIGWANLSVAAGRLTSDVGYAGRPPSPRRIGSLLEAELDRVRTFLRL